MGDETAGGKVKTKPSPLLFIVISLQPGPKWNQVSEPLPREQAVMKLAEEWKLGRLARLIRKQTAKAA